MLDLSMCILDLIEGSIRAGATKIKVGIEDDPRQDLLRITLEDNVLSLEEPLDQVSDHLLEDKDDRMPGVSLLKSAAERAEGSLSLSKSAMGGLKIDATMKNSHPVRAPFGDLAAAISSVVCTNPALDLVCNLQFGKEVIIVSVADVAGIASSMNRFGLEVARGVNRQITSALQSLGLADDPRLKDEG